MMKILSLLWSSSPKSLLQAIMQFTLLCILFAFLIIKSSTLESHRSFQAASHSETSSLVLPHTTPSAFLSPKISDWDQQRRALNANSSRVRPPRKPRILLVTGSSPYKCENPQGDHSLLKFIKNKMDYCRLHGIDIFYNMAHLDSEMTDCWSKLPLLRKLMLSHPEIEWLWWMDSDAMFTDMTFQLPMEKYKPYNMVVHGWPEQVYGRRSWTGLNAGVFLIRNCQWTLDLMEEWGSMGGGSRATREELGRFFTSYLINRPFFEGDDQAGLVYLLNAEKERWGSKVHLENEYFLHGYWEIVVDKYEEMMKSSHPGYGDERWPFVTHFVGCKPCGPQSKERCLQQMERAFNFADNQVLQPYGFHHQQLDSPSVASV